jgi:hypothetical protein
MLKKFFTTVLCLFLCISLSLQAFAAENPAIGVTQLSEDGSVTRTVSEAIGIDEALYNTTYKGQPAQRKVIKDLKGSVLFDAYITEQDNIRTVYRVENEKVISTRSALISNGYIFPQDFPPTGFRFIMSVPHPSLDITGNLYGKNYDEYGSYYDFSWTAGTRFGIIAEAFILRFGGTFNVGGLLISLGVAVVAGIIDGVLEGKVRYKYDNWDYEVWAWDELGLRTTKYDVYEQVFDSKGNFVEDIYLYSDGDSRSLKDITIAGAYFVYIYNL